MLHYDAGGADRHYTHRQCTAEEFPIEALSGRRLHKQNFRRLVEASAIVEATGETTMKTGGGPAALFRFRRNVAPERSAPGLRVGIKR